VIWRFTPALVAVVAYEALPAFLFSLGMAVIVSLFTRPTPDPNLLKDLQLEEREDLPDVVFPPAADLEGEL